MNQKEIVTSSLTIALGVATVCVLITRQARTTSSDKSSSAPGKLNSAAAKAAEPAKGDSEKNTLKEFPINDAFEFPFLGKVEAHARTETLQIESETGGTLTVPFKTFYSPEGVFLHAVYEKPGADDYTNTTETIQSSYLQQEERIVGFPAKNATVSFAEVLAKCSKSMAEHFDFNLATRVDVSYVLWQRQAEDYRPLYIINVYGCEKIADYLPNEARFKRIRYLFNDEGEMLVFDNLL